MLGANRELDSSITIKSIVSHLCSNPQCLSLSQRQPKEILQRPSASPRDGDATTHETRERHRRNEATKQRANRRRKSAGAVHVERHSLAARLSLASLAHSHNLSDYPTILLARCVTCHDHRRHHGHQQLALSVADHALQECSTQGPSRFHMCLRPRIFRARLTRERSFDRWFVGVCSDEHGSVLPRNSAMVATSC